MSDKTQYQFRTKSLYKLEAKENFLNFTRSVLKHTPTVSSQSDGQDRPLSALEFSIVLGVLAGTLRQEKQKA